MKQTRGQQRLRQARSLAAILAAGAVALALAPIAAVAAEPGWTVDYSDRGAVTVKAGDAVVYTDAEALIFISSPRYKYVYAWTTSAWADGFARPTRVDRMKGNVRVVTFTVSANPKLRVTKQITELSPRSLKIVIKVTADAGSPADIIEYDGLFPPQTYAGASISANGGGYDWHSISPLPSLAALASGGQGDDLRYNISRLTFGLNDLGGQPADIVCGFLESPRSADGTNFRGWRFYSGVDGVKKPVFQIRNIYQFDSAFPFERVLEIRLAWN
jgi:hypothetical protein